MQNAPAVVLLSVLLQNGCIARHIPTFAGPFTVHVDKMLPCEGIPKTNWTHFLHISRYNPYKPAEKQIITGNVTLARTFDDTAWLTLRMSVWANNEWKKNAFIMKFPTKGCSKFRTEFPSFFFIVFKGARHTGVCSIPPKTYPINDPVDWNFPNVKVFPYGNYLATLSAGESGQKNPCYCMEFYAHVRPKVH